MIVEVFDSVKVVCGKLIMINICIVIGLGMKVGGIFKVYYGVIDVESVCVVKIFVG